MPTTRPARDTPTGKPMTPQNRDWRPVPARRCVNCRDTDPADHDERYPEAEGQPATPSDASATFVATELCATSGLTASVKGNTALDSGMTDLRRTAAEMGANAISGLIVLPA